MPRREAPRPNPTNNLCERCGQQPPLISNENFQGRPNRPEAGDGRDGPPPNAKGGVAGTTTAHQANTKRSVESLSPDNSRLEHIGTTENVMDQRLDATIAIADATGATLDAVVARLGTAPEAEFAAFTGTLAVLTAARPASPIPELHGAHRRVTEAMAAKDEDDPDLIDAAAEIEAALLAARPVTIADTYRRLLALAPTLASDLYAPELAPLRAEIEATIGGEV